MKWSFLLFSSLICLQAVAQYPATGNKARLGWQTTGDGLVYRGAIGDTTILDPSGLNNAWMLLDTASGNLYAYRAKAWRLVSGGGGGGGGLTMPFDSVTFNVNETDASLRELKYSEEKGYLQYGGQDSVQIPILPGIWYVRNDTSVTIPKGTVLRATGTLGASGRIKVKHMIANGSIDAMYILGIAMHDIAVGADGYAMSQGKIRQVNTQAYSEGAVLYADVDTLGGLTQTEPGNGFLKLPIAFVVHSASNGVLAVRVTPGAYMRDLHDVEVTSPDSSASLYYNAAQGIWRDTTAAALKSDISGTTNYLAKFTGANTVGNSNVYQDATGNIGVGTTSPLYKLSVAKYTSGTTQGEIVQSIIGNTVYSTVGQWAGLSLGTYADKVGIFAYDGYNNFGRNDLVFAVASGGNTNPVTLTDEKMRILNNGNVGIATASPSRPLHVNSNISMIIPSGATGTRPAAGADGDLRYSTTFSNIEFYRTDRWMRPLVGTVANNKVAFASGDTLTSNTNFHFDNSTTKLGIGNASPDSTLTVTGGIRATTGVRAKQLNVNTSGTQVLSINNYSGNTNANPNNVFIGNGGQSATGTGTQGRSNIGIGTNALLSITVGEGSIGIGTNAMATRADTMQSNIAIGGGAMQFQGSAKNNDNTAIGTNALRYNKGGNYNVALGSNALTQNTTSVNNDTAGVSGGSNNFGLGFSACYWNGTGLQNIGIGSSANYFNRNGSYNIAIGGSALAGGSSNADTMAKNNNVAIGTQALQFLQGNGAGNSDENVAIGYHAGRSYGSGAGTNFTAGKTSVYIGAYTRANANTNENEIAIGYGTIGNGSNTTTISNGSTTHNVFQYGEMLFGYAKSADVGDYRVQVNGNGYVSGDFRIGYTADQGAYPLQVNGQIFATNATIATSDARLKQDIEPLKSGLKEVLSLNPVTYTFKPDTVNNYPKGKQVGFLAQEIQSTVQGDYAGSIVQEAGGYLGVADTKLIPLLVKAIQEQQAQIEALKKEIEALKNK